MKLRIGLSPRDDAKVVLDVSRALGEETRLMVNFNQAVTPRAAPLTAG